MRVIAGSARRMRLVTPQGLDTRPTQDIIKETLFNMIQFDLPGSVFVDICAGSGQMGIEAISRGARKAYFIEKGREAVSCIQKNLHTVKFEDQAVVLRQDVLSALRHIHEKRVDFIYMDPPFRKNLERAVLERLAGSPILTPDTLIIVEAAGETEFDYIADLGYRLIKEKVYKTSRHEFLAFGSGGQE